MVHPQANSETMQSIKQQFDRDGYVVVKGMMNAEEVALLTDTFMSLHAGGPITGCFNPIPPEEANGDVLKLYPRMMHPHRVNPVAQNFMLHPRVMETLAALFEEEPLATQSMFYFKPPGAKGQALHQDNYYLKVKPGTCIAAWTAVDPSDEENGGLVVVPFTNHEPIHCPKAADPAVSFTKELVDVPEGKTVLSLKLDAGDTLFFNGSVIHGSFPNRSKDRFRRSFICHYAGVSSFSISPGYNPIMTKEGDKLQIGQIPDAGPCGNEFGSSTAAAAVHEPH
jgi:ectoine hydroxylase-related dioxygenase (phytanoyl-CoA dioxygenase family)